MAVGDDGTFDYDYSAAGFDSFLSRSIDDLSQTNLDSPGPVSTANAYDRQQSSGSIGDSLGVGNIRIDGVSGRIDIVDDQGNVVARFGNLDA